MEDIKVTFTFTVNVKIEYSHVIKNILSEHRCELNYEKEVPDGVKFKATVMEDELLNYEDAIDNVINLIQCEVSNCSEPSIKIKNKRKLMELIYPK